MKGKIINVFNNDLYGTVDDRKVILYAAFVHKKYMNKYVIFSFLGEEDKNILHCGSVHFKDKSVVTFEIKKDIEKYIMEFISELLGDKLSEFELLDISNILKIELVSYSEFKFDRINELFNKTIVFEEEKVVEEKKSSGTGFLYFLLFFLIAALGGLLYFKFNPDILSNEGKVLNCNYSINDKGFSHNIMATVRFNKRDILESLSVEEKIQFLEISTYQNFKDNQSHLNYFDKEVVVEYNDTEMNLNASYERNLVVNEYEDVKLYLENQGYICEVGKNEE